MAYTTVSELSVEELKSLIREVVEQTIKELFSDPDEGLELQEEVKLLLQESIETLRSRKNLTVPAHQVAENLGLEW